LSAEAAAICSAVAPDLAIASDYFPAKTQPAGVLMAKPVSGFVTVNGGIMSMRTAAELAEHLDHIEREHYRTLRIVMLIPCVMLWLMASVVPLVTAAAPDPGPKTGHDGNVCWEEVWHDTFDLFYRDRSGAIPRSLPGAGSAVRLRLRTAHYDLTSVRLRVWDPVGGGEFWHDMQWDGEVDDSIIYDWWTVQIPVPEYTTILYYFFELNDNGGGGADTDYYVDDEPRLYGGGGGAMIAGWDDSRSFQIVIYDPAIETPEWLRRGVIMQIFPETFRNGSLISEPWPGGECYGQSPCRGVYAEWNSCLCDPRGLREPVCPDMWNMYHGGDLSGITHKIEEGYFDALGVSVIYLNPIFWAWSYHRYDAATYAVEDPFLGSGPDVDYLLQAADAHGINIILDLVPNHCSSGSVYFDRYSQWPPPGACESAESTYRPWFYFYENAAGSCAPNSGSSTPTDYADWFGFDSLAKFNSGEAAVRDFFFRGDRSVVRYWLSRGFKGFRVDVPLDIDLGRGVDPSNTYFEELRAAMKQDCPDCALIAEHWGDASTYFLGGEFDSTMNYRFRSAMLCWLYTGCYGDGCVPAAGTIPQRFFDNDAYPGSDTGPLYRIAPSALHARLLSIWEDCPPPVFESLMNLAGSHDTNRIQFLLRKINNDNQGAAEQRLKELWNFMFTYSGAPAVYCPDELGASADGVFAHGRWEDDPYNRIPVPWPDETGDCYSADEGLWQHFCRLSSIHHACRPFQDGAITHGIVLDDGRMLYGFARSTSDQTAAVLFNRSDDHHTVELSHVNSPPYNWEDGTDIVDVLTGARYVAADNYLVNELGQRQVQVNSNWAAVLVEQDKLDAPAAPEIEAARDGCHLRLSWPQVILDTAGGKEVCIGYEIHASLSPQFMPTADTFVASVPIPMFGSADGRLEYEIDGTSGLGYYFAVVAVTAAGEYSRSRVVSGGDVNGDGEVTPGDAQLTFFFWIDCDEYVLPIEQYQRANFCGPCATESCDFSVTPGDALGILRAALQFVNPCGL